MLTISSSVVLSACEVFSWLAFAGAHETVAENAAAELAEEMGIQGVELLHLFNYFHVSEGLQYWGSLFSCVYDGPMRLQPEEVRADAHPIRIVNPRCTSHFSHRAPGTVALNSPGQRRFLRSLMTGVAISVLRHTAYCCCSPINIRTYASRNAVLCHVKLVVASITAACRCFRGPGCCGPLCTGGERPVHVSPGPPAFQSSGPAP